MMGYFVYFQVIKSEDFINNPYNSRQENFKESIVRGKILSADGEVLAETVVDSQGNETRNYPYGNMFAHVVGYSTRGRSGIESQANFNLLRSHKFFLEKAVDEMKDEKSLGDNVVTTLDYSLQRTAYNALGGYDGAVVVMEPETGKILAMVSKPDFDPNTIESEWDSIVSEKSTDSVLVNRATQGLYPPGSTFKILTTLAYIRQNPKDYERYSYQCNGNITVGNSKLGCFGGEVHGTVDLRKSFSESCNSSFANIGLNLNLDEFAAMCNTLYFNKALPVNFEASKSSFVLNEDSSTSEIMETSIGQGQTLVTPLLMLAVTSAVNYDGILMRPYLIDKVTGTDNSEVKKYEAKEAGQLMSDQEAKLLQSYMEEVVNTGTGSKLSGQSYTAGGKTGSAEYSNTKGESHAWFVGYAHREDKKDIAVSVIVEGAGIGSAHAVPIAKEIFDTYYAN